MRFRTAYLAAALAAAIGFSSVALAGDEAEIKVRDLDKDRSVKSERVKAERVERWDRGDWTDHRTVRGEREYGRVTARPMESGVLAGRQFSGPYRYFFTDHEGKYNYFLDRYNYPYRYGGTEQALPTNVLGFVPPEQVGGGPVMYYRQEQPLSRSPFDRGGRME